MIRCHTNEVSVVTLEEIQYALKQLSAEDRIVMYDWIDEVINTANRRHRTQEPRPAYAPTQPTFMTLDEYFEFEEHNRLPYEYINGMVHAISSPSVAHARIKGQLLVTLDELVAEGALPIHKAHRPQREGDDLPPRPVH
jgi:hypothetical protein